MTLIGRVGQDPVIRGSQEKPVTLFQLATSQSFKSPDGVSTCGTLNRIKLLLCICYRPRQ